MHSPLLAISLLGFQPAPDAGPTAPDARSPAPDTPTEVAAPTEVEAPEPAPPAEVPAAEVTTTSPAVTPSSPEEKTPVATTEDETPEKPIDARKDPTPIQATKFVPGKGFELASKDGRFSVMIRARAQVRYEMHHPNVEGENTEQVLMIRRLRLQFQGNVFGKHNKYYIQFGFSPLDMTRGLLASEDGDIKRNPVRDARLEFDYLRDLTVWVGQMKVPFSRQRVISSGNLNMVDRSIVNEEFQLDRDIGIQFLSKDIAGLGWLAYNAGVFMGEGRNTFALQDFGMLYVARLELTPLGKFDDYSEGDVFREEKPKLSVGGAYAFHDNAQGVNSTNGDRFADGGTTDFHHIGADAMFKWKGLSAQTAFQWRKGVNRKGGGAVDEDGNLVPIEIPKSGVGWFAQVGFLVPRIELEIVGRYALVRNVFGSSSSLEFADEAGGGLNYYFAGHNLKLQLDYFRLWNASMGPGYANAVRHGTDRVRLQVQLAF